MTCLSELILILISRRTHIYTYSDSLLDLILKENLFLSRSYTYSSQILFLFGFLVCCAELIHVCILISSLYLFRSPVGFTEPMLIQRYLNTYCYLDLSHISRRSLQNLYLSYGVYTCSEIPVGITEITERILVIRSTYLSYRTYTGLTELIIVFRIQKYP